MYGVWSEALDKVGDDSGSRGSVEEHDLFHNEAAMEDDLVDLGSPGRSRVIAEFGIEAEIGPAARESGRCVEPSLRPPAVPVPEKEMMDLVRRHQVAYASESLDLGGQ